MAALAHLTAMDGGNAGDCREQSLPCASRHLHIHVQWRECKRIVGTILALQSYRETLWSNSKSGTGSAAVGWKAGA